MDVSDHMDLTVKAPFDTAILVVACASALTVLALAAVTCICCDRKRSDRTSSSSLRDTVPLDDLLSKPSLADPESVFSEAGSYEFLRSARAGSWLRVSGDGSSAVCESVSVSALSCGDKDHGNLSDGTQLHNNPDSQTSTSKFQKWNCQSHKHVPTGKEELVHEHGQQRRSTTNSKVVAGFPSIQTTNPCGHMTDGWGHDFGGSVKVCGSPKTYNHKDISGKVGLDSAALQIHRHSVTRDNTPFLTSTRCSFSHEIGHMVHGNKVPRTSLPTTEEADQGHSLLTTEEADQTRRQYLSALNRNNECRNRAAELSLKLVADHRRTWCPGTVIKSSDGDSHHTHEHRGFGQKGCRHENKPNPPTPEFTSTDIHTNKLNPSTPEFTSTDIHTNKPNPSTPEFTSTDIHTNKPNPPTLEFTSTDIHTNKPNPPTLEFTSTDIHTNKPNPSTPEFTSTDIHTNKPNPPTLEFTSTNIHTHAAKCYPPLPKPDAHSNTSRCTNDSQVFQHGHVAMRRCMSCVHGDEICSEKLAKPRRKTFSLNLKIDVHFDTDPESHENLHTVVCSPITEYRECHKHSASQDIHQCMASNIISNTSQMSDQCMASSIISNTSQMSDPIDADTKKVLLEKYIPAKCQNAGSDISGVVCTRHSETLESRARHLSKCPEVGPQTLADPGQLSGHSTPRREDPGTTTTRGTYLTGYVRETGQGAAEKQKLASGSDGGLVKPELPRATTAEIPTTQADVSYDGPDNQDNQTVCSTSIESRHLSVANINESCEAQTDPDDPGADDNKNNEKRNDVKQCNLDPSLTSETRGEVLGQEEEDQPSTRAGSNINRRDTMVTADIKMTCQADDVHTTTASVGADDSCVSRDCSPDTNMGCVTERPVSPARGTQSAIEEMPSGDVERHSSSDASNINSLHGGHRRAQTVKYRYGLVDAANSEAIDSRFQRASSLKAASSLKVQSINKRAEPPTSHHRRRQAVLFDDKQNLANNSGSFIAEQVSKQNVPITQEGHEMDAGENGVCPVQRANIEERLHQAGQHQAADKPAFTNRAIHKQALASTSRHDSKGSEDINISFHKPETTAVAEDQAASHVGRSVIRIVIGDDERALVSACERSRCTSDISDDCTTQVEAAAISDDSDYDNPWDNLDDAVKRASIRYNRRPSRIAAGETKTLLLKSAEDLGRLLEEADKRRQLRRDSCQVISPVTDSMTIPFTRFSPHRHTVKGIVSQPHMTSCHSTEDILKMENPTFPKLSLLRQETEDGQTCTGVDVRRPMSLTSKVKAKIISPETKKRKK